eukprot:SAG31_NODE_346_length_17349_cov_9.825875_10_plen_147_part_00
MQVSQVSGGQGTSFCLSSRQTQRSRPPLVPAHRRNPRPQARLEELPRSCGTPQTALESPLGVESLVPSRARLGLAGSLGQWTSGSDGLVRALVRRADGLAQLRTVSPQGKQFTTSKSSDQCARPTVAVPSLRSGSAALCRAFGYDR